MRPMMNIFLLFGSSVGFYANPMMRRMGTVTIGSIAGTQLLRAAAATSVPSQPRSKLSTDTSMSATEFVDKEVEGNGVVIFSKSYCPFCRQTKNLFHTLDVEHAVYELDLMDDGDAIHAALKTKTGQRTVPNVFVKGKHVGGNDAVQAANQSGALKELLEGLSTEF
ncbi:unnamed protein product [Ascophyllum nodosum]